MKKRSIALGFLISAMLITTPTTYVAASDYSQQMTGAYEANTKEDLPDDAREAFENAIKNYKTDEKLTPIRLLETQVVAGTNYRILCDKERDNTEGEALITIYEDLDGKCEVTDEQNVYCPVKYKSAMNKTDFTMGARFDATDFNWTEKTLTFERFDDMEYISGIFILLKKGDLIDFDGKIITVETIKKSETTRTNSYGESERDAVVTINEDTINQVRFVAGEGGHYFAATSDDLPCLEKIDQLTLPFTENLKFTDCTSNPNEEVTVPYEELQSYMQDKIDHGDSGYYPSNTTVDVTNGIIVSIKRTWMP